MAKRMPRLQLAPRQWGDKKIVTVTQLAAAPEWWVSRQPYAKTACLYVLFYRPTDATTAEAAVATLQQTERGGAMGCTTVGGYWCWMSVEEAIHGWFALTPADRQAKADRRDADRAAYDRKRA